MLLATHDSAGELRVYRLRIDFERSNFDARHLALLASCKSSLKPAGSTPSTETTTLIQGELTQLEFIAAGPDSKTRTPPHILAAFSRIVHDFTGNDTVESSMCTWTLQLATPSLHPALKQLGPSKIINEPTNQPSVSTNTSSGSNDRLILCHYS